MSSGADTEAFVKLYTKHEPALFRYVLTLLPSVSEAQDVMQETSTALWRRFSEYDASRPFAPWAYRFAYYEVLRHRRNKDRSRLVITDTALELLAEEYAEQEDSLEDARYALRDCLTKLPDHQRKLVHDRYGKELRVAEIASRLGRPQITIYKGLERVRKLLLDCIRGGLAAGG